MKNFQFSIFNFQWLLILGLFGISCFGFSTSAYAATLSVGADINQVKTGEIFTVTILLDTEEESINTIEGDLEYDENFLQAEVVNIGSSFVSFWVEKPDIKTLGTIHFSGIIPGGISTTEGEMLKVIFRATQTGNTTLSLNNVNLFLNNGEGTETLAKFSNASIEITESTDDARSPIVVEDTVLPEKFEVIRTKDISIYDNKYFVAFSAIDKGSGVDYYEVCELFRCLIGESPFLLKNQTPFYRLTVRAYDINGNVRESSLTSSYLIGLIILLLIIIIIIHFYRRYLHSDNV